MGAFFVFSRNAATDHNPQFQLRVKCRRTKSRKDERILSAAYLSPQPGLRNFYPPDPRLKP